jgi:hypothetical protein
VRKGWQKNWSDEARRHPEQSVEGILETSCWMALYFHIHQTTVPPEAPPSLWQRLKPEKDTKVSTCAVFRQ